MPYAHILTPSFSASATVTSTNEEANAPASGMLTDDTAERWQTQNLTAMQVTVDAGVATAWNAVFLGYNNGQTGDMRITSNATTGTLFSAPSYDSASDPDNAPLRFPEFTEFGDFTEHHGWFEPSSTQTYRYVGIEILDAFNPAGFFTCGILQIGMLFTPGIAARLPSSRGYRDVSSIDEGTNGVRLVRQRRIIQSQSLEWEGLEEADLMRFDNIQRLYGTSRAIVVKRDPLDPQFGRNLLTHGLADWGGVNSITETTQHGQGRVELTIREV